MDLSDTHHVVLESTAKRLQNTSYFILHSPFLMAKSTINGHFSVFWTCPFTRKKTKHPDSRHWCTTGRCRWSPSCSTTAPVRFSFLRESISTAPCFRAFFLFWHKIVSACQFNSYVWHNQRVLSCHFGDSWHVGCSQWDDHPIFLMGKWHSTIRVDHGTNTQPGYDIHSSPWKITMLLIGKPSISIRAI